MNLSVRDGALYADNLKFCYCEAGNGRTNIEPRSGEVRTSYSHKLGEVLPFVDDIGWWIGSDLECDIILGNVLSSNGPIPCGSCVKRLVGMVERAESIGERVTLVVIHD